MALLDEAAPLQQRDVGAVQALGRGVGVRRPSSGPGRRSRRGTASGSPRGTWRRTTARVAGRAELDHHPDVLGALGLDRHVELVVDEVRVGDAQHPRAGQRGERREVLGRRCRGRSAAPRPCCRASCPACTLGLIFHQRSFVHVPSPGNVGVPVALVLDAVDPAPVPLDVHLVPRRHGLERSATTTCGGGTWRGPRRSRSRRRTASCRRGPRCARRRAIGGAPTSSSGSCSFSGCGSPSPTYTHTRPSASATG